MLNLARVVVRYRRTILVLYVILIACSLYFLPNINIDYDISSALPTDIDSIKALRILRDEVRVGESVNIYWKNGELRDVESAVRKIQDLDYVKSVSWLGSLVDPAVPREFWQSEANRWINGQDYNIVVQTSATSGSIGDVLDRLKAVLPSNTYLISAQEQIRHLRAYFTGKPVLYLGLGIALVALFLLIYFEKPLTPILIVASMAAAVVLNMGISGLLRQHMFYVVRIVVEILQLAVSYDYGLFLYHRYKEERAIKGDEDGMAVAVAKTSKAITLAALTTLAGFGALTQASLEISKQIGWLLLRGVTISFVVSLTLLPSLLLVFESRRQQRPVDWEKPVASLSTLVGKASMPLFASLLVVSFLAFWGSQSTVVSYSNDFYVPSKLGYVKIQREFEQKFQSYDTWMVVLEKKGDYPTAFKEIGDLPLVSSVVNPWAFLDPAIPEEMVPPRLLDKFSSAKYVYATVYTKVNPDTREAADLRSQMERLLAGYDGEHYVTGLSIVMDDIKQLSMRDNTKTTWITLVLIFAVLSFGFRNVLLPFVLIAVIEASIKLNLWWAGLAGAVTFMVPITLSTVQLGSTIDYAVLCATRFEEAIASGSQDPIVATIKGSAASILVSAATFFLMSLPAALLSDIRGLSQIMGALARGAVFSAFSVILFLPPTFQILGRVLFGRRLAR
ncbi:MMPL family transporter [Coprothermobacteraceae bacterium]|nr:MMPL family transporter [Coprothermobacteraceae bacterium]